MKQFINLFNEIKAMLFMRMIIADMEYLFKAQMIMDILEKMTDGVKWWMI